MKKLGILLSLFLGFLMFSFSSFAEELGGGTYFETTVAVTCLSADSQKGIENAIFSVFKVNENSEAVQLTTISTDRKGNGSAVLNLENGDYYICQSLVPYGYIKNEETVPFSVNGKPVSLDEIFYNTFQNSDIKFELSNTLIESFPGHAYTADVKTLSGSKGMLTSNLVLSFDVPLNTNLESLETGLYNRQNAINIFYKTNVHTDYRLWTVVSGDESKFLYVTGLPQNEYVTSVVFDYGDVGPGFNLVGGLKFNLKSGNFFANGQILSGSFILSGFIDGVKTVSSSSVDIVIDTSNESLDGITEEDGDDTSIHDELVIASANEQSLASPQTGDSTSIVPYIVGLVISILVVALLVFLLIKGRRKR